ncbi:hypothetical protein [Mucilaginibacter pedocola]|uniref:Uncharacterized protein n=1 Tax=Mucilaginibacter pedocola TaxID=1792845 RepID=A0A1S9PIU2_9SPHI|nr:hypothetical protein [Mucilaginibacter pedocola]OOQ60866.1 hypothetical protein BC343_23160 [Mucilaginibacter pedocola]
MFEILLAQLWLNPKYESSIQKNKTRKKRVLHYSKPVCKEDKGIERDTLCTNNRASWVYSVIEQHIISVGRKLNCLGNSFQLIQMFYYALIEGRTGSSS